MWQTAAVAAGFWQVRKMPEGWPAADEALPAWWNVGTARCQRAGQQPEGRDPGFIVWLPGLGPRVAINCLCDLSYITSLSPGFLIFER